MISTDIIAVIIRIIVFNWLINSRNTKYKIKTAGKWRLSKIRPRKSECGSSVSPGVKAKIDRPITSTNNINKANFFFPCSSFAFWCRFLFFKLE